MKIHRQVWLLLLIAGCSFNAFNPTDGRPTEGMDSKGYNLEGERLLREGDFDGAIYAFGKAIELDSCAGYPRIGMGKAWFDKYDFSQKKVIEIFYSEETQAQNQFQNLVNMFDPQKWSYPRIDSLYAPIHIAVRQMDTLFTRKYRATDGFEPEWVAADYSLLLTFHAFISLLDYNNDGNISMPGDNQFSGLRVVINPDTVIIEGLDAILNDDTMLKEWKQKATESLHEVTTAFEVFEKTFADSTNSFEQVDSLLKKFEATLEEYKLPDAQND